MGGAYVRDASVSQTYHGQIELALDSAKLTHAGTLSIGFLDHFAFDGFDSLGFKLEYEGNTVIDVSFLTLTAADAFFDDQVMTIGDFAPGPELDIDIDFTFAGSKAGQGYGFAFLIGADADVTDGGGVTAVPEPGTLLTFAGGLLGLLASATASRRRR
jgi:hypothetical protein